MDIMGDSSIINVQIPYYTIANGDNWTFLLGGYNFNESYPISIHVTLPELILEDS